MARLAPDVLTRILGSFDLNGNQADLMERSLQAAEEKAYWRGKAIAYADAKAQLSDAIKSLLLHEQGEGLPQSVCDWVQALAKQKGATCWEWKRRAWKNEQLWLVFYKPFPCITKENKKRYSPSEDCVVFVLKQEDYLCTRELGDTLSHTRETRYEFGRGADTYWPSVSKYAIPIEQSIWENQLRR